MNIQEPPIRASYHTHERTCNYDNVEDIVHTSSQWQVKNSDGSWSDYTASTYDKGIYRCAYTVWIETYKDKAQFTEDFLNVEVDIDMTQATVMSSTVDGEWRQTVVVYSREYEIDPSKIVTYDTVTATVALNPTYGAPIYGSYPEWSIAEDNVWLQSLSWEKQNPDGSFSWVEDFEESATFEEGVYRANLLITALAVKLSDGGPVLYRQTRLTKDGKTFSLLKFRSMRVDAEADGVARLSTGAQDSRVTAVGRVLRKYRIDELPQLLNILAGDLSIVGPRPERPAIAAEYEQTLPEFRLRLQAKAGLTGYAQVYGKYNTDPYHKLQLDLMYIANPGFLEDLRICFATVKTLFMAESTEGVQEGMTTAMETEETVAASRRG